MQLFAAIDFETSSSERNSACAIGYVIFNQSKIIKKQSYLIKPPKPEVYYTDIHGLTWEMLKKEKTFDKVWRSIKDELLVVDYFFAHNAPFDRSVLHSSCYYYNLDIPQQEFKDTVKIARNFWDFENNKLNTVCKNLRIPLNHHDALSDAKGCAMIAIEAFKKGYVI
ncbi:MAG: 3'-5' exonuclease [Alphaproteobacteria bacterium]